MRLSRTQGVPARRVVEHHLTVLYLVQEPTRSFRTWNIPSDFTCSYRRGLLSIFMCLHDFSFTKTTRITWVDLKDNIVQPISLSHLWARAVTSVWTWALSKHQIWTHYVWFYLFQWIIILTLKICIYFVVWIRLISNSKQMDTCMLSLEVIKNPYDSKASSLQVSGRWPFF